MASYRDATEKVLILRKVAQDKAYLYVLRYYILYAKTVFQWRHCGGDTGHGGRTYFRIQDAACTDMEIHSYTTRCGSNGFEVCLGGDCELETMIRALKFITKVLEEESKEVYD